MSLYVLIIPTRREVVRSGAWFITAVCQAPSPRIYPLPNFSALPPPAHVPRSRNQLVKQHMPIDTSHQYHIKTIGSSPDTPLQVAAAAAAAAATAAAIAAGAAAVAAASPPTATTAAQRLSLCTGTTTHVPKDGACLFSAALLELKRLLCDSMRHSEGMLHSAFALRQQTAAWIYHHADCSFGDIPLREWIGHETGETVSQYCSRMRLPTEWGGVIELFVISRIFGVGVWIYERAASPEVYAPGRPAAPYMRRTHALEPPAVAAAAAASGERTASGAACLLYDGSSHYDVFSPAAGPALKIPRGLPAGAENARHVHQVLRCSDDLDLSRCTALAPEVPRCWEDASWHDLGCVAALAPPAASGAGDALRPPPPPPPLVGFLGRVVAGEQPPVLKPRSLAIKAALPSPPLRGGGGFAACSHGASTGDELEQAGGGSSAVDFGTAAALAPTGSAPRLARRPVRKVWPWRSRRRAGELQLQEVRV